MTWRGSNTPVDRILACVIYLLPLLESIRYGGYIFNLLPLLATLILVPLSPLLNFYQGLLRGIPFGGLVIFFALFLLVVRNTNLSHFLRFNAMQSLLLKIALSLVAIVTQLLGLPLQAAAMSENLLMTVLANLLFLAFFGGSLYAIIQAALGRYPDLPLVSDAAYRQVQR
ncbi:hypothetical protein NEA10_09830 [Phormidium yuhuli AB48]|uniref:Uncharacterized protein n=1 Tax=Phormidium yuhuli AB48 TaxID=2940671 RepID=A0ABY5AUS8_9CYAN|nr:Tic20 family protein [Phormidium yuhuli]USR92989.1 hypothetical protein NEA10_09830 [Phormidium yuhuli AB48]